MNGWTCNIHAKNDDFPIDFAIYTKALPTDGPTDRPTDQRTDIPSYRDAIAASKKQLGNSLGLFFFLLPKTRFLMNVGKSYLKCDFIIVAKF